MKWRIYLIATILTALATYGAAEKTGFSTEGIVDWIATMMLGGAFWGFVGNWIYSRKRN